MILAEEYTNSYLFEGMDQPQLLQSFNFKTKPQNNPKKQDRKRTVQMPVVRDLSTDTEPFQVTDYP